MQDKHQGFILRGTRLEIVSSVHLRQVSDQFHVTLWVASQLVNQVSCNTFAEAETYYASFLEIFQRWEKTSFHTGDSQ